MPTPKKPTVKNSLAPKLRFKEFKDEWINRKLSELILKLDSGVSVNSVDESVESIDQYGVLKTSCISSGRFFPQENKKIVEGDLSRAKLNPAKNSILISRMNTPQLVGHSGLVEKDYPNLFVPDRLWMTVINTNEANPKFLSVILSSEKTMGMISNIATGTSGSMKNISKTNFLNLEIYFPTLPEQQKIASFLSAVDEKIQQLTRKKELLEQYKKGVMQQFFSSSELGLGGLKDDRINADQTNPSILKSKKSQFRQLRFKDSNGKPYPKWEVKRLEDICSFFSGGTPQSTNKNYYSGSIPFIGSGNIYDSEVSTFISEEALNNSSAKLVEKGDLLFALYGANSGEVAISKISGAINQAILCIRTEEDTRYLYYLLFHNQGRIVAKYLQGGQGNLSAVIVRKLKYKFPSIEEQQKIACFLTALDAKIETINQQIAQTQTFKKGLLQQMFV